VPWKSPWPAVRPPAPPENRPAAVREDHRLALTLPGDAEPNQQRGRPATGRLRVQSGWFTIRKAENLRNIAAGVFTGGIATVMHQARIYHTEQQLTVYHLTYGPDETVESVQKESRSDASHEGRHKTNL
jgi:hypothetical protein